MKRSIIKGTIVVNVVLLIVGVFLRLEAYPMADIFLLLAGTMVLLAYIISAILIVRSKTTPTVIKGWYFLLGFVPYYLLLDLEKRK